MKTTIGQSARGEDFFPRQEITNEIWTKLDSGSDLLFVAPRRVGKSSLLFDLLDNPRDEYIVTYFTCESVNSLDEFYKKLFNHIIELLKGRKKLSAKVSKFTKEFLSRIESLNLKEGSIGLGETTISYIDETTKLLKDFAAEDDTLLILVDEFSQAVENIKQDQGESEALTFLQTKREIRQSPVIHPKTRFIYAGSIGLENIVNRMNGMNFINDLNPVLVPPLRREETHELVNKIINDDQISFQEGAEEYLRELIEWWIPFYFMIIMDECGHFLSKRKTTIITKEIIDQSFESALTKRLYFEHWLTRLRKAYKGEEFSFVKDVLNIISERTILNSAEIFNLAVKYSIANSYNDLMNALKHDGYINNIVDPKIYRFNSPLLRTWWYNNVAN